MIQKYLSNSNLTIVLCFRNNQNQRLECCQISFSGCEFVVVYVPLQILPLYLKCPFTPFL